METPKAGEELCVLTDRELKLLKAMADSDPQMSELYESELEKQGKLTEAEETDPYAEIPDRELLRLAEFCGWEGDNLEAANRYNAEIQRRRQTGTWSLDNVK